MNKGHDGKQVPSPLARLHKKYILSSSLEIIRFESVKNMLIFT